MKPYIMQRVGRVIGVLNIYKPVKTIINIIERNINFIIYLLLKVGRFKGCGLAVAGCYFRDKE